MKMSSFSWFIFRLRKYFIFPKFVIFNFFIAIFLKSSISFVLLPIFKRSSTYRDCHDSTYFLASIQGCIIKTPLESFCFTQRTYFTIPSSWILVFHTQIFHFLATQILQVELHKFSFQANHLEIYTLHLHLKFPISFEQQV